MAVVTEGIAGIADIADDIALVDPLALADGDSAHVCVQGGIGAVVVNGDVIAPGIAPIIGAVCGHDRTGAGCHDRRAAACGDIHAVVAVAECTADAGPARNRPCLLYTSPSPRDA